MILSKALLPIALVAFAPSSFGQTATNSSSAYFGGVDDAPYQDWINRFGVKYDESIFLQPGTDPANGAAIHWSVNLTHLSLSLAVRAVGWAGFGIAENGGMRGADMMLYEATTNQVTDAYVLDDLQPLTDDCNDWELVNSTNEGGFLIVEVRRELDTGDSQDRPIVNDAELAIPPQRVIAAWGDSDQVTYHGPNDRVRGAIRFFGSQSGTELEQFHKAMEEEAEGHFDLLASNHTIRAVDTEYALFCFTTQDLIDMGVPVASELHTIGIEPIVENHKYVHHYVVGASEFGNVTCNPNTEVDDDEDDDIFTGDDPEDDFRQLVYVWAPGEVALLLPPNVGQPLGAGGFKAFIIEIHYNNPTLDTGVVDNSGVRFHYTSQKREFDLGVWQVGDPSVNLFGQPVGNGLSSHTFECPGTCSSLFFPGMVTVFREYLHMHGSGVKMYNSQIRNGEEVRRTTVGFWDFDQNGNFAPVQEPYEFLPGDGYKTECFFRGQGEVFGLSSSEEMCMTTIFYYPKVTLDGFSPLCGYGYDFIPECNSAHVTRPLGNATELERTFGTPSESCNSSDTVSPTVIPGGATEPPEPTISPIPLVTPSPVAAPVGEDSSRYFGGVDNEIYLDWVERAGGNYDVSLFMQPGNDPQNGAAVHWTLTSEYLSLSLAVRASGWAGFGIGENGGMRGADMMLYEAATDQVTDAYVLDDLEPLTDNCNDWELVNSTNEGGFLIVEVRRKLDTGDSQDRPIANDTDLSIPPHPVIAAWGDSDEVTYHGPNDRVRSAIRFFGSQPGTELERFQKAMEEEAEGHFDLLASNHTVRAVDTEYALFCFTQQDLIDMGVPMSSELHTIGFEPIIENHKYVHHFVLYASEFGNVTCKPNTEVDNVEDDDVFTGDDPEGAFGQPAYVWAPGQGPVYLPPNVGQPLGAGGGFKAFLMEIHYNNPTLDSGVTDSSGVRLHYTRKKREFDLGVWQVGDPDVNLFGQPVGDGLSSHTFDCPGTCSSFLFPNKVTVLREYLHMHKSGVKMYNSQIRDGSEIRRTEVGFWDFNQSGSLAPVQKPYEFHPGDGYKTECVYNGSKDEVFGLSSSEEMCIVFVFYYPKVSHDGYSPICGFGYDFLPQCDSPHEVRSLVELGRVFGEAPQTCGGSVDQPTPSPSPVQSSSTEEPTSSPTSSGTPMQRFGTSLLSLFVAMSLTVLHA